jgi:hypothetical protein
MKSFALVTILATSLPAVLAQGGWGNGGRGGFRGGNRGPPQHDAPPSQGFPVQPGSFDQPSTFSTVAVPNTAPTGAAANTPAAPDSGNGGSTSSSSGGVDVSLIPPYGVTPGIALNDGTPRCAGDQGKPIDCDCPPDVNQLAAATADAVAGGMSFPTGKLSNIFLSTQRLISI